MIAFSVENTKNDDSIGSCLKKNLVWEAPQQNSPKIAIVNRVFSRAVPQLMDSLIYHFEKLVAKSGPLGLVPARGFVKVCFRAATNED